MAQQGEIEDTYKQEDDQVAYVFDPDQDESRPERATKRRRVSKSKVKVTEKLEQQSAFIPLLNGTEQPEFMQLRESLFQESWAKVDERIQNILLESNRATLDEVTEFVGSAETECSDQVPSAFIITGPNIASQDLLFEQLSKTLQGSFASKFIRLRSSEAANLKATLKKIISDVTKTPSLEADDGIDEDFRRYLDYDLETLHAWCNSKGLKHVFVTFQDSEGFDSGLLSELIVLLNSWRPQIPFTLLFGIATSVELLQARLLKSACQLIYGAQFDVIQTETILETVVKAAVAASDLPLQLGAPLLKIMLGRQHDQVAGIQTFDMSLKYAYMCYFYANPLSVLLAHGSNKGSPLQSEHFEAIRNLDSFRVHVEQAAASGTLEHLGHAKSLIQDDEYLQVKIQEALADRNRWLNDILRFLLIVMASGAQDGEFSQAYVTALENGISASDNSAIVDAVRRMDLDALCAFLERVVSIFELGDEELRLGPCSSPEEAVLGDSFSALLNRLVALKAHAEKLNMTVRSKYSSHSKVMRTTVIAQRVQLSQDSAALTDDDKVLTDIVDEVTNLLVSHVYAPKAGSVLLSEAWLYDSRTPSRDVFVPRPRAVLERSLTRPHDYLSCSCCREGSGGAQSTLPAASILYHLYLETGNLINVADLWTAFAGIVGETDQDEREILVQFYRGLAELGALGFVKGSKKKVDHMAKLKWL